MKLLLARVIVTKSALIYITEKWKAKYQLMQHSKANADDILNYTKRAF